MKTTRRALLTAAGGGMAAGWVAGAVGAPDRRPDAVSAAWRTSVPNHAYGEVLEKVRAQALREQAAVGFPGLTLCLVADGFSATLGLGYADIADQVPVNSHHLFSIGSISKSITALAMHALAASGKLELDAPVSHYLPGVPLPDTPITLRQLLNHTSGLSGNVPLFPLNPQRRHWLCSTPGMTVSYSNLGYALLGLVIGAVTGQPHSRAIHELVLAPLGMTSAKAHLLATDRTRYATGYIPKGNVRASLTLAPIMPAPFIDYDLADGGVAASSEDMIGYLRYVIALGNGKGQPLMPDGQARELLAHENPADDFGPGARYASGFIKSDSDGHPVLRHTGGTPQFGSSFHADPAAGVACFASANANIAGYRPTGITEYAIQLLRALRDRRAPPAPVDPLARHAIAQPERLAGRYVAADGAVIELNRAAAGLQLVADQARGRLEPAGPAVLLTDHPKYGTHSIHYEVSNGTVARLWWRDQSFTRGAAAPRAQRQPSLEPFAGLYTDLTPWTRLEIFVRDAHLHLEGQGLLTRRPEGFWSPHHDTEGRTRLWFEDMVNGKYYTLCFSGARLSRAAG